MSGARPETASAAAIAFHYDLSVEFYRLWLDPLLTYSAAIWEQPLDNRDPRALHAAQLRKLRYALAESGAGSARRLLDVGCGWGSLLQVAVQDGIEHALGLTLSRVQAEHVRQLGDPRIGVEYCHFRDYVPAVPHDALCCIGTFEHFARLGQSEADRLALYREFFSWCHAVLAPGSRMFLQCIAYGDFDREQHSAFFANQVFPESDMPRLWEICHSVDRLFEVERVRNDREDYVRTVNAWHRNLRHARAQAAAVTSQETVDRYLKYLGLSAIMLHKGSTVLYRISLRRLGRS